MMHDSGTISCLAAATSNTSRRSIFIQMQYVEELEYGTIFLISPMRLLYFASFLLVCGDCHSSFIPMMLQYVGVSGVPSRLPSASVDSTENANPIPPYHCQ
uniref:Uncharacterized protein n=1 Tax=Chaetoceros debilis TaxID=122233 RepID=A0A7S3V9G5_9STRA